MFASSGIRDLSRSETVARGSSRKAAPDKSQQIAGISEVAKRIGVTTRTLRFYEERGILNPIRRGATRFYDQAQQNRIRKIVKARNLGFTLAEIAEMMENEPSNDAAGAVFHLDKPTIESQLRLMKDRKQEIDEAIVELEAALAAQSDKGRDAPTR